MSPTSVIRIGPNGDTQECGFDAQRSRDDGSRGGGFRAAQGRRCAPVQYDAEDPSPNGSSGSRPKASKACATAHRAAVQTHLEPYNSETGRPSIDPELIIWMLIVGYRFGIRWERRLCEEEVHRNLAYAGSVAWDSTISSSSPS
jgi:hypothetical protein